MTGCCASVTCPVCLEAFKGARYPSITRAMALPLTFVPIRWLILCAVLALAVLATCVADPAAAASKKKATTTASAFPTISKVTPARAQVGETLTIRGKNFLVGKNRTTVVFKRDGKKAIFVKAQLSTKTMLKVAVPPTIETQLETRGGYPLFTKFRLRVGAKRFAKRYTSNKLTLGPVPQPGADADACAKVRTGNDPNGDLDGDFLTNAEELRLKPNPLNPCVGDTDGDTMTDGWEFFAARDLNSRALPYPSKRPFPNALDPADTGYDYDGDGLKAKTEFELWAAFGKPYQSMADRDQLLYSDGTKTSNGPGPNQLTNLSTLQGNAAACGYTAVPPSLAYLGREYVDATATVEDDQKDADQDGLGNWAETVGSMKQEWWVSIYGTEKPYGLRNFADLSPTDPDVDGDGCLDGLDDQDADDWPNWTEYGAHETTWFDTATQWLSFPPMGTTYPGWDGWADAGNTGPLPFAAHPFNPCLPEVTSRTCSKYTPVADGWPPFNEAYGAGCKTTVTFRGRTVGVWLWDRSTKLPLVGSCPV
jgi:hypothetical protein